VKQWILATALLATGASGPAVAGAGDVNAHNFYVSAKSLLAKGVGAMFDSRRKPMTAQLRDAAVAVKAQNDAAKAKGAPIYCVSDAQRKKGMSVQFIVDQLGAIPEQQRRTMTLKDAWRNVLVRNYPCR
jgi:hypothetical protein